ncbi:MAG: helix-turn-helix transcriptional regulator [Ottowia sp.]|jgi:hypothetical protein|nr:helix-turn-helix transcriptional regulator [Ottowia sp.]
MITKRKNPRCKEDAERLQAIFKNVRANDRSMTQEKLAFICGWKTQGAVSQYFLGKMPLNFDALLRFSKALHVDPAEISPSLAAQLPQPAILEKPQENIEGDSEERSQLYDLMHLKESIVRFGPEPECRIMYEQAKESEPITYRYAWLRARGINPENARRFKVSEESMEPFLFGDDSVLVNIAETDIDNGKVYALRYGNDLRIRRLFKKLDGTLLLRSDNPGFFDEEVAPDQVNRHITIIGRVRGKFGSGGL